MKKTLSIVLCLMILLGAIAVGGDGFANMFEKISIKASAEDTVFSVGDIVTYGIYPQSRVTSQSLIAALNEQDGSWISYNYYSGEDSTGSMTPSDYMRYKDVVYNNNKYRAVTFDKYRPHLTNKQPNADNSYQDENGYQTGTVYWFKYENLKWRILNPSNGLVMCNSIIDNQPFNSYLISKGKTPDGDYLSWGDYSQTYYGSNYSKSSLRSWLYKFTKVAFPAQTILISHSISNLSYNTISGSSSNGRYDNVDSYESIYLLSYEDVINPDYGFASTTSASDTRKLTASDYSKCQGLRNQRWTLRTPYYSYQSGTVSPDGIVHYYGSNTNTCLGICPAMRIELSNFYHIIYNSNGGSTPPETQFGNGNTVITSVKPTKSNYVFLGWATTPDATTAQYQADSIINLTDNTTLYAVWEFKDTSKPTCAISSTNNIADSQTATLSMSDTVGLAGYYWGTSSTYSDNVYTEISGMNQVVEKPITSSGTYYLTAKDIYNNISTTASKSFCQTILDTNGGTVSQPSVITMYGYAFILPTPSKTGFTFNKWTTNADGSGTSYEDGANYVVKSNITLYAQWTKNSSTSYTLSYNSNGGSNAPVNQTGNGNITLSNIKPLRNGFTFLGWATTSNATSAQYQPNSTFNLTADTTLYAVWKQNETPSNPNNPLSKAKITIKPSATVDYRSSVTITATAKDVPEKFILAIYEGNTLKEKGTNTSISYTPLDKNGKPVELTSYTVYTVKIIDANETVQKDSNGFEITAKCEVTVKATFFDKLIAFFRGLFGLLPMVKI